MLVVSTDAVYVAKVENLVSILAVYNLKVSDLVFSDAENALSDAVDSSNLLNLAFCAVLVVSFEPV